MYAFNHSKISRLVKSFCPFITPVMWKFPGNGEFPICDVIGSQRVKLDKINHFLNHLESVQWNICF